MLGIKLSKDTKVTPMVFLAFMILLAAMSGLAAGVGYAVKHLKHASEHGRPS